MAASIKRRVLDKTGVEPTEGRQGGLICTIRVVALDNGFIKVGRLPAVGDSSDPALSWLWASESVSTALTEFYQQVCRRVT